MENREIYQSKFDSDVTIVIIFPDDEQYEEASRLFRADKTEAFVYPDKKLIMIDGNVVLQDWFTGNHLSVLEAHEVAHIRLGHKGERILQQEEDADRMAYEMLSESGDDEAAELCRQE